MVWSFCKVAVGTGMGYAEKIGYKPKVFGEAIVHNPFDRELMAAVICGSFESLERRPFDYAWKVVNGDDVIRIEPAEARPEVASRFDFTLQPTRKGRRELGRELGEEVYPVIMDAQRSISLRNLSEGYLLAVHQFVEGRKPAVEWKQLDPSTVQYTLG